MATDGQLPGAQPKGGLWRVVVREVRIITRSWFYVLFVFVLPLISFGILGAEFYQEIPRDLPIVVVDGDDSALSRQIVRALDASSALTVRATVRDRLEGAVRIREGNVYAMIYLPPDLEKDALRGEAPPITLYFNNQWMLVSSLISRAARDTVGTLSTQLDLHTRIARGEDPARAYESVEPVRVDQHLLFNPNLNYRYFLLPGLLPMMIQIFIMMVTIRALGTELRYSTARAWLAASGNRPWIAILGKLLPYTVCFMALTGFMLAALVRFANVPIYGNVWVLTLASVLFVLAYQSVGLMVIALAPNLRLANSIAGFYSAPAFAFVGITYPLIGMPLAAKLWSLSLPLYHYLHIMLQQALRGAPPEASIGPLLTLALFAAVPPALLMKRMGHLMRNPAYWGRT